jgi:hypothetical protein
MPPVRHDVDPFDSSHPSREVLVQTFITALDHDQEPEARQWSRARLPQKLRQVTLAEAVGFDGVVQRLALPELGRRPFGPAPRADRFHGVLASPTAT